MSLITKNTALRVFLVLVMTFTLLFSDLYFGIFSVVIASDDVYETQDTITSSSSVLFDAYFRKDSQNVHRLVSDYLNTQTLYLRVKTRDSSSLENINISFESPNFIFGDITSPYVKAYDNESASLELINLSSNSEFIVEIPIKFNEEEKDNISYYLRDINVNFSADVYNEETFKTTATHTIVINFGYSQKIDFEVEQTYKQFYSDENKVYLVYELKEKLDNVVVPKVGDNVNILIPNIAGVNANVEKVIYNGKQLDNFSILEGDFYLNREEQTKQDDEIIDTQVSQSMQDITDISSTTSTINVANKIDINPTYININSTSTEMIDTATYTVIYSWDDLTYLCPNTLSLGYYLTSSFRNCDDITKVDEEEEQVVPNGSYISIETKIKDEIYDGRFRNAVESYEEIVEQNSISVSKVVGNEKIFIEPNGLKYLNAGVEQITKTTISGISLKVDEATNVLGENFIISIYNLNDELITTLNKNLASDNGYISVTFDEQEEIRLQLTSAVSIGSFNIDITKRLYPVSVVDEIVLSSTIRSADIVYSSNDSYVLKEAKTKVKQEISNTSLYTNTENELEITTTLLEDSSKYMLYLNPTIEIILPRQVEETTIENINISQADVKYITNIDKQEEQTVLKIDLEYNSGDYKATGTEGLKVTTKLNLKLDEFAFSEIEDVVINVINNKTGDVVTKQEDLNIYNPNEIISKIHVSSQDLDYTLTQEDEKYEIILDKENYSKEYNVSYTLKNNTNEILDDIKIIGIIGTNGTYDIKENEYENNLNVSLKDSVNIDREARIYYTENDKATDDLENSSNGWSDTLLNLNNVKKYLIIIDTFELGDEVNISFSLNVPENIEDNQESIIEQDIYYINNEDKQINSNIVNIRTKKSAKLETSVKVSKSNVELKDNDVINPSDILKLEIDATNTGDMNLETAFIQIDNNNFDIVNTNSDYDEIDEYYMSYIMDLNSDEQTSLSFDIRAKEGISTFNDDTNIVIKSNGENSIYTIPKLSLENSEGKVIVDLVEYQAATGQTRANELVTYHGYVEYILRIYNGTEDTIKDAKFELLGNQSIGYSLIYYNQWLIDVWNGGEYSSDDKEVESFNNFDDKNLYIGDLEPGYHFYFMRLNLEDDIDVETTDIYGTFSYDKTSIATNLITETYEQTYNFELEMSAEENKTYEAEDYLIYNAIFTSNNETGKYILTDTLPAQLTVKNIYINNEQVYKEGDKNEPVVDDEGCTAYAYPSYGVDSNVMNMYLNVEKGSVLNIKIVSTVNKIYSASSTMTITNHIEGEYGGTSRKVSNEVNSTIKTYQDISENTVFIGTTADSSSSGNISGSVTNNSSGGTLNNSSTSKTATYTISGYAFLDENSDGIYSNESTLSNIEISLYDSNGSLVKSITTSNGKYNFSSLSSGTYTLKATIPDEYDITAVSSSTSGNKFTKQDSSTAVTTISLDSNQVANIGFITTTSFIPTVDKYISKITVINDSGTFNYTYDNAKIAKVEIESSKIENSQVVITYQFKITNTGDKVGYITKIEDLLPTGLELKSENNKSWYTSGSVATNTSMANTKIEPGQSITVEAIGVKTMTNNNIGVIENTGTITPINNKGGTLSDSAKVIVSVKTGETNLVFTLVLCFIILVLGYITYINRVEFKITREEQEKWKELINK